MVRRGAKTKVASWTALIHKFLQKKASQPCAGSARVSCADRSDTAEGRSISTCSRRSTRRGELPSRADQGDQVKPAELTARIAETRGGARKTPPPFPTFWRRRRARRGMAEAGEARSCGYGGAL